MSGMKDKSVIPKGWYCYKPKDDGENFRGSIRIELCPYWDWHPMRDEQCCGYCHYLEEGDWDNGICGLLWDQVKECMWNDFDCRVYDLCEPYCIDSSCCNEYYCDFCNSDIKNDIDFDDYHDNI